MTTKNQSTIAIVHCILIVFLLCDGLLLKTSANPFDLYKNKDVIATRTIPDLTALKFGHVTDQRNEYFSKLLAAWDTLQFDRTFISRGESFCFKI